MNKYNYNYILEAIDYLMYKVKISTLDTKFLIQIYVYYNLHIVTCVMNTLDIPHSRILHTPNCVSREIVRK